MTRLQREWAIRGVLALGLSAIGFISIAGTLANVVVRADARAAQKLAFGDGRIMAASAAQGFAAAPDSAPDSELAVLAREALRRDPTAVEAINLLGLQAQMRLDGAQADKLFGYSVALSRRELEAQLWSIEEAVTRGDIDQALRNYDFALRTSERARQILFPVLASAIAEPSIRIRVADILSDSPAWDRAFIRHASGSSPHPDAVAQLFRAGAGRGFPIEDEDRARIVDRLVARGLMEEAWAYYKEFRPGVDRSRSRDPHFSLGIDAPASFDWNVGSTPGLSIAMLSDDEEAFLDFAAPASTRATAVTQIQILPPGNYRLEGRSRGVDQPERSRPYWTIRCRAGPELGRVDLPSSGEAANTFSTRFSVPTGCPVQTLSLIIRASDDISGVTGQVEHVQVMPAEEP